MEGHFTDRALEHRGRLLDGGPALLGSSRSRASVATIAGSTHCRFCEAPLGLTVIDLGKSPLCQSFLPADRVEAMEPFYPLHVRTCTSCWLAQLPAFVSPEEIFSEYAYFSAFSDSWVEQRTSLRRHDHRAPRPSRRQSLVVELASNDGYLLQHFLPKGIPVLGIDPAINVRSGRRGTWRADARRLLRRPLAEELASEGRQADLVVGKNVLAQVPDLNDFVRGVQILLAPGGTATFEFPHLARLLDGLQYDTIYHEHFSYFLLSTIQEVFAAHDLAVVDVEELSSHGGSLRVYVAHAARRARAIGGRHGADLRARESDGLRDPARYRPLRRGGRRSRSGRFSTS